LITDFYAIDNTVPTIKMIGPDHVNIKTSEGVDLTMDVEVNYRLVQGPDVIRDRIIPECGLGQMLEVQSRRDRSRQPPVRRIVDAYQVKWVRDYSRTVIRYVFGELDASGFYAAALRDQKAREAETELNRLLRPHGIEITKVIPDEAPCWSRSRSPRT